MVQLLATVLLLLMSVVKSILGVLFLMLFVPVAFMVGYLKTRLLPSLVNQRLARRSLYLELYEHSSKRTKKRT